MAKQDTTFLQEIKYLVTFTIESNETKLQEWKLCTSHATCCVDPFFKPSLNRLHKKVVLLGSKVCV